MDGQTFGPYNAKEMTKFDFTPDVLAKESNMPEWIPANSIDFRAIVLQEARTTINNDGTIYRGPQVGTEPSAPLTQTDSCPDESWNWGAFFFGWFWGIFNGVYWPLLTIVVNFLQGYFSGWVSVICGLINFGIQIYLGISGNKLAWEGKIWSSKYEFRRVQKNWAKAAGIVFGISILIIIIYIIVD